MKKLLPIFMIFCLLASSISPACKFLSGKNLMAFCFSDGSVQEMPMPKELLAFMPGAQNETPEQQSSEDCAFCFLTTHFDKIIPSSITTIETKRNYEALALYKETKLRNIFSAYLSRGPPVHFS